VGKAQRSLPQRLRKHRDKLVGRENIALEDMGFVCLYVDEDLDAAAPEKLLIKMYAKALDGVHWNTNGFGNNDPGRQRDQSRVEENHFDARHPIRLTFDELQLTTGRTTIGSLLQELKQQLPYTLRFENEKKSSDARRDYKSEVDVPAGPINAEEAIRLIIRALPEGWQATALPGYLILYKEEKKYPSALRLWRRKGDEVVNPPQATQWAPPSEIREEDGEPRGNTDEE
jgi:hypothetical protein